MIPYDPQILVSYLNTELRDHYKNLDDACKALDLDKDIVIKKLREIEYKYDSNKNRFI